MTRDELSNLYTDLGSSLHDALVGDDDFHLHIRGLSKEKSLLCRDALCLVLMVIQENIVLSLNEERSVAGDVAF